MRYIAAIVGFVVAYLAATVIYAETMPRMVVEFFHDRGLMLGFIMFLISIFGAVCAFLAFS